MTRPFTPVDVEQRLAGLLQRLEKGADEVHNADVKATRLRREFDHAYALAFIDSDGAMELRKYVSIGRTIKQREAAEDAEVALRYARTLLAAVKDEVDVVRSISSSIKASMAA